MALKPQEPFEVAGPAGRLEGRLELPASSPEFLGVFGHPHPQHGGTMQNNVVIHSCRELSQCGGLVARFNFRGVGASEGAFDDGNGELEDFRAVVQFVRERDPSLPLLVGGFSFGAIRAMEFAAQDGADAVLAVAPPLKLERYQGMAQVPCAAALVLAGNDQIAPRPPIGMLKNRFADLRHKSVIDGADHLFVGFLDELREAVNRGLSAIF